MKDNFSRQAAGYAKYRPVYPPELIDFILTNITNRVAALDCGTGNGQTARALSLHFKKVYAIDISRQQLENAEKAANIYYSVQPAEKTDFPDNAFDLVTISQALHWFQFDVFYREVKRVTAPGAWIAAWMYALPRISPAIDILIDRHHFHTLGNYWDPERQYVDDDYRDIPFPFREIPTPVFSIRNKWTLPELEGYLNTWSALQRFISDHSYNPVDGLIREIGLHWQGENMEVVFPVHVRMGQVEK